ncbi:MAG: YkgJ family cysteine cluster protein [Candidatus Helarchaeota archaeon]
MNKCDGHCCSSYTVLITSEDAIRISQGVKLDPEEYLVIYDSSVENQNFYPTITIQENNVVLGIRFKPDSTTCFFLGDNGLCSIHEFKPRVCQTYPFTMDVEGNLIRMEGLSEVCPYQWWPHSSEMTERIRSNLLASWKEIKIYREKAMAWNKNGKNGDFTEFLKFIGCK